MDAKNKELAAKLKAIGEKAVELAEELGNLGDELLDCRDAYLPSLQDPHAEMLRETLARIANRFYSTAYYVDGGGKELNSLFKDVLKSKSERR